MVELIEVKISLSFKLINGSTPMPEPATICFVGTVELKAILERWAKEEDRTVSATLRQILEREVQRREPAPTPLPEPVAQQSK